MSKLPIIVLDFSGVYDHEAFASHHDIIHVDCQDMKGVDCYCDEESRKELHRRLSPYPSKAVHFLDSGDYHYLTEYWVSQSKTELKAIYMKRFFISMIGFLACMKLMAQSPVSFYPQENAQDISIDTCPSASCHQGCRGYRKIFRCKLGIELVEEKG